MFVVFWFFVILVVVVIIFFYGDIDSKGVFGIWECDGVFGVVVVIDVVF